MENFNQNNKTIWVVVGVVIVILFIAFLYKNDNYNNQVESTNNDEMFAPVVQYTEEETSKQQTTTQQIQQNTLDNPSPVVQPTLKSPNEIYADISSRLAFVTCSWLNKNGNVLFSQSFNGLLGPIALNGTSMVTTILSGVTNTSWTGYLTAPGSCTIQFPAGASLYAGGFSSFTVNSDYNGVGPVNIGNIDLDYAQISIKNPNNYIINYARLPNYCSERPSTGDPVVVFGWPIGGVNQTLTGIVTGTSGYYDNTNIVIPKGMEGSTAVSLATGCILGQINAFGQIADMKQISYLLGF